MFDINALIENFPAMWAGAQGVFSIISWIITGVFFMILCYAAWDNLNTRREGTFDKWSKLSAIWVFFVLFIAVRALHKIVI